MDWARLLDDALDEETQKHIAEQQRLVQENPTDPRPYFHLGLLFNMQRRRENAIRMFEQALALDPNFAAAHQQLGQIYAVLGDFNRARAHAREAAARGNPTLLEMLDRYMQDTRD